MSRQRGMLTGHGFPGTMAGIPPPDLAQLAGLGRRLAEILGSRTTVAAYRARAAGRTSQAGPAR